MVLGSKLLPEPIEVRLAQKLTALQSLRPLPEIAVQKLREQFQIEMDYNSNGIEGNRLTLRETALVINEGITIKGKSLRDHLEAKDHHEALEFVYSHVSKNHLPDLSETLVRQVHSLVVKKSETEWAGRYRTAGVAIIGATLQLPEAIAIPAEMQKLLSWYRHHRLATPVIELAAIFHHKLVAIHPFFDGNGRTARLIMNLILMSKGFPLAIILKNDRRKYYRVLSAADKGKYFPLVLFVAQAVERSLDVYLRTLSPNTELEKELVSLAKLARGSPYSAKYLNLLANQGKLEAYKKGRNWFSSKVALKNYLSNLPKVQTKPPAKISSPSGELAQ